MTTKYLKMKNGLRKRSHRDWEESRRKDRSDEEEEEEEEPRIQDHSKRAEKILRIATKVSVNGYRSHSLTEEIVKSSSSSSSSSSEIKVIPIM